MVSARRVIVLDHHKTAFEMFERPAVGNVSFDIGNCTVHLDMDRSGATLALDHWKPRGLTDAQQHLFLYVEDADLWRWKLPDSRQFHAGVQHALSLFCLHPGIILKHCIPKRAPISTCFISEVGNRDTH
jgi:oligoribonuclease NrnB/cAMP/cGMP phosphodiesterase (DHH superfamily)